MRDLILADSVVLTGMVYLELLQGAGSEQEANQLVTRFQILPRMDATGSIWEEVARLSRHLRRRAIHVPIPDLWIAQVAMDHDLIVLHCDRDFERIASHSSLKTLSYL